MSVRYIHARHSKSFFRFFDDGLRPTHISKKNIAAATIGLEAVPDAVVRHAALSWLHIGPLDVRIARKLVLFFVGPEVTFFRQILAFCRRYDDSYHWHSVLSWCGVALDSFSFLPFDLCSSNIVFVCIEFLFVVQAAWPSISPRRIAS
jgi:hypothetical protein